MTFATKLPPTTYLFSDLTTNESLFYSTFLHFTSLKTLTNQEALDATLQLLHNHLSRVTLTTIIRTLKTRRYITPKTLSPINPLQSFQNPPITNKTVTTKMGRPVKHPFILPTHLE